MTEKALITTALIYANGPLHLGHIVEQIQADIWVRNKKMQGVDCVFISGDDAHGTPIMLSAAKQNITPEEMIKTIHMEHKNDSKDFLISYDYYDSTHNEANKEIVYDIKNTVLLKTQINANQSIGNSNRSNPLHWELQ